MTAFQQARAWERRAIIVERVASILITFAGAFIVGCLL